MAAAAAGEPGLNYYDVLGVPDEATPPEIKQAYKRMARHWHPDKAHGKDSDKVLAERRFKEVSEAYTVLNDARQRSAYDLYLRCRHQGFVEVADPSGSRNGYTSVPFSDWPEFLRLLEGVANVPSAGSGAQGRGRRGPRPAAASPADGEDSPISIWEWLLAGGALFSFWAVAAWQHERRQWLKALPIDIWRSHCEYSTPLSLLLSPFFFGNVPFRDAADWLNAALKRADY